MWEHSGEPLSLFLPFEHLYVNCSSNSQGLLVHWRRRHRYSTLNLRTPFELNKLISRAGPRKKPARATSLPNVKSTKFLGFLVILKAMVILPSLLLKSLKSAKIRENSVNISEKVNCKSFSLRLRGSRMKIAGCEKRKLQH